MHPEIESIAQLVSCLVLVVGLIGVARLHLTWRKAGCPSYPKPDDAQIREQRRKQSGTKRIK